MKSIELTADQIKKLWEMCQKLFPEIDIESIEDNGMILGIDTHIHWFEFCVNHLLEKLNLYYYNYTRYNLESKTKIHLVDYLYEQFKRLK